jgi:hypothetical protein
MKISRKQSESVCRFLTVLVALELIGVEEFMTVAVGLEEFIGEGIWDDKSFMLRLAEFCYNQ